MKTNKRYSPTARKRAVRLVFDQQHQHSSQWAAIESIASKIGCTPETLRRWVRQSETDQGKRSGISSTDRGRLRELERENRELKQANEILRKAAAFFAQAELGRRVKYWCRLSTNIEENMGSSRSASNCRSPHQPTTSINYASKTQTGPLTEANGTSG